MAKWQKWNACLSVVTLCMYGLPVFSTASKKRRSCHSILITSEKLKKLKKSITLLRSIEELRSQGKTPPPKLARMTSEYRESQRHKSWGLLGNQWWGRKTQWQINGDSVWASLRDENSRGTHSSEAHQIFVSVTSREAHQVLTGNIKEKSLCASGREERGSKLFEICQSFLFSLTSSVLKRASLIRV